MKSMNEITIPETTITPEQYDYNARQLVATIMLQATRDYCRTKSETKRKTVAKELRSDWMRFITNNTSVVVAEQLEKNYDAIKARLIKEEEV